MSLNATQQAEFAAFLREGGWIFYRPQKRSGHRTPVHAEVSAETVVGELAMRLDIHVARVERSEARVLPMRRPEGGVEL